MKNKNKLPQNLDEKPEAKPKIRLVTPEELTTSGSSPRSRSTLVQQFMDYSDQIDAEIAKILAL